MSATVIVTISYPVKLDKIVQYQHLVEQFVRAVNETQGGIEVSVYASDEKANAFVEVYECFNNESFDNLEDNYDEHTRELVIAISDCLEDRQTIRTLTKRIG
jgi:quinol monooxygenase YgiN